MEKTNDEFEMGAVGVYHDDPSSMYTDHPGRSVYTDLPERTEGDNSLEHRRGDVQ